MKNKFDAIVTAGRIALGVFRFLVRDSEGAGRVERAIDIAEDVAETVSARAPKPKTKSKAKAKAKPMK